MWILVPPAEIDKRVGLVGIQTGGAARLGGEADSKQADFDFLIGERLDKGNGERRPNTY